MTGCHRIAIASVMACLAFPAGAGQTRIVEIDIEPVVVLRCDDSISLDLGAGQILQALEQPVRQRSRVRALPSRGVMVADLGNVSETARRTPVLPLPLERPCAVRGLSRGEGFVVDIRLGPDPVLRGTDGTSRIAVLRASGRMSDTTGSFANRFTIPQSRVRLDTWTEIDFLLDLDFSRAGTNGTYRSDSDGVFVVDVSTP